MKAGARDSGDFWSAFHEKAGWREADFFLSSLFLFDSLAGAFVAAEVQSRARRFCAAKRILDGFSAATV